MRGGDGKEWRGKGWRCMARSRGVKGGGDEEWRWWRGEG